MGTRSQWTPFARLRRHGTESLHPRRFAKKLLPSSEPTSHGRFIEKIYGPGMDASMLARFSPCVEKCATSGDTTAIALIERNMDELAKIAAATAFAAEGQIFWLYGGVFENSKFMGNIFAAALAKHAPGSSTRVLGVSPAVGAMLYGFKMRGGTQSGSGRSKIGRAHV